jgi:hypothetical protein
MPTDTDSKITIAYTDLETRKVDQRLKEQEALARNRRQADAQNLAADVEPAGGGASLWYNPVFAMAIFGLLGGVLAWGGGEILRLRPDPRAEAKALMRAVADENDLVAQNRLTPADADAAVDQLKQEGAANPYFNVYIDNSRSPAQKSAALASLDRRESMKNFIANVLSFGLSGMLIAAALAIAEPTIERNRRGMFVNGIAGAALGLVGGVVVSLFVEQLYNWLLNAAGPAATPAAAPTGSTDLSGQQILARSVTWGILGLFLLLGPGVVMRNVKKLLIGMLGGLVGGLVGGALFDPIAAATGGNAHLGRLVALVAIGTVAGALTGLIENAAKSGWLKVTAGLIAGKQFILYRNPTLIGAGPECQIYLFRDPQVGRRHAAIHIVPGGFELENLPLGGSTLVNRNPVTRARLRNGDVVQIGNSTFRFAEKTREQGK